jgi:peroxiredoxin Q/BCP
VSLEGVEKHKAFAESLKLNFLLVADQKQTVAAGFGVQRLWGLVPFAKRVTFVVDKAGVVRNVIASELNIDKHVDEAIETLRSMA